MSSTPQLPETIYCDRCRRLVPRDECPVTSYDVGAGLPTDQLPEHIHVRTHRVCRRRIWLPGAAKETA